VSQLSSERGTSIAKFALIIIILSVVAGTIILYVFNGTTYLANWFAQVNRIMLDTSNITYTNETIVFPNATGSGSVTVIVPQPQPVDSYSKGLTDLYSVYKTYLAYFLLIAGGGGLLYFLIIDIVMSGAGDIE